MRNQPEEFELHYSHTFIRSSNFINALAVILVCFLKAFKQIKIAVIISLLPIQLVLLKLHLALKYMLEVSCALLTKWGYSDNWINAVQEVVF